MHKLIDLKGDEFINQIIESFTKEENVVEKKEGDVKKRNPISKKEQKIRDARMQEIDALTNIIEKNFQLQMDDLLHSVDDIIQQTSVIEGATELFKKTELSDLLRVGKDDFDFKIKRKLGKFLKGKSETDIEWSKSNNQNYSSVDKEDPLKLIIKGTTCYTYYQTTTKFNDEDVVIDLEYNIQTSDNYFYLGFINSAVVPSSNCMCCTIQNAVYIQPNGDVVVNGARQNKTQLLANKGKTHNLIIRFDSGDKSLYFTMDDNEEVGPFKIPGKDFKFVSGSCNTVTGYVKINSVTS